VSLSVARALLAAHAMGLDRLDAQLLLGHLMQRPRAWLIAHDDAIVPDDLATRFAADCQRRAAGEPLAYLTGEREFHGLRLQVSPAVLVPRPDTETLVDWALACCAEAPTDRPLALLDLGTGSGAIALALAHALRTRHPAARITATDLSPDALAVAATNAQRLGLAVEFSQGAWWAAVLPERRFDLIASNPPYICEGDPHLPALRHEPIAALTSGADGLDALRAIVASAPQHLLPGGWLLLEHGWDQADAASRLLADAGFSGVATRPDIEGRPRCSGGRWYPP